MTIYRNVNFITGRQTCHLIWDLPKRSYKPKSHDDPENEWSSSIMKCGNLSKLRSLLFGGQAFQLIKDFMFIHATIQIMYKMLNILTRFSVKFVANGEASFL